MLVALLCAQVRTAVARDTGVDILPHGQSPPGDGSGQLRPPGDDSGQPAGALHGHQGGAGSIVLQGGVGAARGAARGVCHGVSTGGGTGVLAEVCWRGRSRHQRGLKPPPEGRSAGGGARAPLEASPGCPHASGGPF